MIWMGDRGDHAAGAAVVLVVEDEWLLRELAAEIIEEAGFVTLVAGNAEEAMVLLEARSDIAVMFTDINMPGHVDGLELAHTVRDRWPTIKILVSSGRVCLVPSELPPGSAFLEKPYCGAAVVAQLRSLAGSPRP
jgi:CheY-like chemotaxis protein